MTRKHFEAIAETFRSNKHMDADTLEAMAHDLAAQFREINRNFDKEKFIAACGLSE